MDLAPALLSGDRRALARAISAVEDQRPGHEAVLAAVASRRCGVPILGITGSPGAGKSTLVSAIVDELRKRERTVAVLAVDPSSPVSGGAVLGDRVRMLDHTDDVGVYVRSVASRGRVGGLAWTTASIVDLLDAAGFDCVIVETVGAGQSEVDIAGIADLTVVVTAPGAGDDVQTLKAGILEVADVLVVNKGDLPGADLARRDLEAMLSLSDGPEVPLLTTTATSGEGVAGLVDFIPSQAGGRAAIIRRTVAAVRATAEHLVREALADDAELTTLAERVVDGETSIDKAASRWVSRAIGEAGPTG